MIYRLSVYLLLVLVCGQVQAGLRDDEAQALQQELTRERLLLQQERQQLLQQQAVLPPALAREREAATAEQQRAEQARERW